MFLLCTSTFLLGAGVAAMTRPARKVQSPRVGALTGPRNPCNLLIEAHRVDNRLAEPDREMKMVYLNVNDPDVANECALTLVKRAKKLGKSPAAENTALREGMKGWYKSEGSVAYTGTNRGSFTFGPA